MKSKSVIAIDMGEKEMKVTLELSDTQFVIFTPFEKIAISRKELEEFFDIKPKEEPKQEWRKDKRNA